MHCNYYHSGRLLSSIPNKATVKIDCTIRSDVHMEFFADAVWAGYMLSKLLSASLHTAFTVYGAVVKIN
jgi:hypothetical protein